MIGYLSPVLLSTCAFVFVLLGIQELAVSISAQCRPSNQILHCIISSSQRYSYVGRVLLYSYRGSVPNFS
jgi:hypothetical protein